MQQNNKFKRGELVLVELEGEGPRQIILTTIVAVNFAVGEAPGYVLATDPTDLIDEKDLSEYTASPCDHLYELGDELFKVDFGDSESSDQVVFTQVIGVLFEPDEPQKVAYVMADAIDAQEQEDEVFRTFEEAAAFMKRRQAEDEA